MGELAVRLDAVGRSFGPVDALLPLDVHVPAGTVLGIIGHNGSGKSTLLQLIAGRLRPSQGRIEVDGVDLATPAGREHARRWVAVGGTIGAFYPDLTVAEHLQLVAIAHDAGDIDARVEEQLERAGLTARRDALTGQLSTGMRQKLDLALASIRPFRVLLLDEPDRGLDPAARQRVWDDVATQRAAGRTILVATHQPAGLEELFDRVLLLESGEVLASGTLAEVRSTEAARRLGLGG